MLESVINTIHGASRLDVFEIAVVVNGIEGIEERGPSVTARYSIFPLALQFYNCFLHICCLFFLDVIWDTHGNFVYMERTKYTLISSPGDVSLFGNMLKETHAT
jgi:hypothetical protein